jgi:hypothetical protein
MSWLSRFIRKRSTFERRTLATCAAAIVAVGAMASSATATTGASLPDARANYGFQTLDNHNDPTFNQLLGINQTGTIAGYFGSGMAGHPNKGYLLANDGQGGYRNENFPGSQQTQVTGLNDTGITVGFWANAKGANFGFYRTQGGRFRTADYPTADQASPPVDQLLGVNDHGTAVGFYNDAKGNSHGYSYSITTHSYRRVTVPGATSVTAAAINAAGDVAGFETNGGTAEGFLKRDDGRVITLSVPGSSMTQALGVNDGDVVVGVYQVGTGNSAMSHGFIWAPGFGFETVDDPNGVGATTVNGINDHGRLVGFYVDSSGNTHGFLATP